MKNKFALIAIIITLNCFGQTAQEFLQTGIEKAEKQKYQEAIKDFSNAIKKDATLADAFFSRGTVKMNLSDFSGALEDFNQTIKINPKQINAIYNRAGVYANTEKFKEALNDLNLVVSIDEKFPSALTLRGQVKMILNDEEGGCKDFNRAKEIGDQSAISYISKYCNNIKVEDEVFVLNWPQKENWKQQTPQENDKMKFVEFLRNNETFENWTEIGTMITYKGITGEDVEFRAQSMYQITKEKCPQAKFTIIEMDKKIEYPWIIFSTECPVSDETKTPESQLWYLVQGNASLYLCDRAVKQKFLPKDKLLNWTKFFKTAEIVSKKN